jgi:hypothetical protein
MVNYYKVSCGAVLKGLLAQPGKLYFACFFLLSLYLLVFQVPPTTASLVNILVWSPISWTFQEYWAHRLLMHGSVATIRHAHQNHHRKPMDKKKIFIPMLLTLVFALGNYLPLHWAFGRATAQSSFVSIVWYYLLFELVHWDCHNLPNYRLLAGPRLFHTRHHAVPFEENACNFGFTSATWDLIFGTCDSQTKQSPHSWILYIPFPVLPLVVFYFVQL